MAEKTYKVTEKQLNRMLERLIQTVGKRERILLLYVIREITGCDLATAKEVLACSEGRFA
jgi:hypothetical protein